MNRDGVSAVRPPGMEAAAGRGGDPISGRILDSMTSGVMLIDEQGAISKLNPLAADLLGLDHRAVIQRPFADVFLGDDAFEEFNDLVLSAMYDDSIGHQGVANVSVRGRNVPLSVATSYLYDTSSTGERIRFGVVAVFSDISEIARLRAKEIELARDLASKHEELRGAYVSLEDRNRELGTVLRRMRMVRTVATACVVVLVAGIGAWLWNESPADWFEIREARSSEPADAQRFVTVQPTRIASSITVATEIKPRREVAVTSPIRGTVGAVHVQHGETVAAGQPLVDLDVTEETIKRRTAQVAWLKAKTQVEEFADWESGIDASKAKRAVTKARIALEAARTRLAQTRFLVEQGLVPAARKDAQERELSTRRLDLEAAEENRDAVLARGRKSHEVAGLELANALAELEKIDGILRSSSVVAPVAGVVLHRPPSATGERGLLPSAGTAVDQGQHLLTIGDMRGITATGRVDEVDVRRIRPGQGVRVAGPAFPGIALDGRIVHVSSQASRSAFGQGLPGFEVSAVVEVLNEAQRAAVRLGMSANMEIVIYENDEALAVPVHAVDLSAGSPRVRVADAASGAVRVVAVKTGMTSMDSVEVLEGVAPGDRVLVP